MKQERPELWNSVFSEMHVSSCKYYPLPPGGILKVGQTVVRVLIQAFCQLENQNDWYGLTHMVGAISRLTINLRRALLLQVNSRLRRERSGSQRNLPRSVHPGFSGRWRKLWAKFSACVFPVSFLLPQCPDAEINKIGAQSVRRSLQCARDRADMSQSETHVYIDYDL